MPKPPQVKTDEGKSLASSVVMNTNLVHQDDNLILLIETLQSIDTKAKLAKLNETTMTDNNGGRIEF